MALLANSKKKITNLEHIMLNCTNNNKDYESTQRDLTKDSFTIPIDIFNNIVVDITIEKLILTQNQQNN